MTNPLGDLCNYLACLRGWDIATYTEVERMAEIAMRHHDNVQAERDDLSAKLIAVRAAMDGKVPMPVRQGVFHPSDDDDPGADHLAAIKEILSDVFETDFSAFARSDYDRAFEHAEALARELDKATAEWGHWKASFNRKFLESEALASALTEAEGDRDYLRNQLADTMETLAEAEARTDAFERLATAMWPIVDFRTITDPGVITAVNDAAYVCERTYGWNPGDTTEGDDDATTG